MADFGASFSMPFSLGMPGIPSLSLGSSASSSLNQQGAAFAGSGSGAWSVNLGGSGTSNQNASASAAAGLSSINPTLLIALGVAAWLILKK